MTDHTEDGASIDSLIAKLRELSDGLGCHDLDKLAMMHEVCEGLSTTAASRSPAGTCPFGRTATQLVSTLETVILSQVSDPDKALTEIADSIAELARLAADLPAAVPVDSAPPCDSAGTSADRLACVFDEDSDDSDKSSTIPDVTPSAGDSANGNPGAPVKNGETDTAPAQSETVEVAPPYEPEPLFIADAELEIVRGFVEEAQEHLDGIEAALLEVERAPDDASKIDDLFRPFHTIKGAAGFLNFRDINCLTHELETLLDQARKGKRAVVSGLIDLVFDVVDVLKVQIAAVSTYAASPNGEVIPQPPIIDMIGFLRDVVSGRCKPSGGGDSPETADKLGEHLAAQNVCPREVVEHAIETQKSGPPDKKLGTILKDMGVATPRQVAQGLRAQTQARQGAPAGDQSIRIDTSKLDALIDMVGELVIAQTQVIASETVSVDSKLVKNVGQVGKIVRDVQEVAMSMRMLPIGPTFQKMNRLVRDVSRKAGKRVELHISGEETELDKNVIQQINDPLVHMIRNAVDHGVESAEKRTANGKDETGHIYLSACHHGGNIVIEIRDDGAGLDPIKLMAKAVEKGVIQPGEELSDQQAYQLIFAPGFSMAAKVTDISGRGVGMDVVRRNIEQLRGKVEISSELGRGSTFSIRLPLTLAIIDGMVVRLGSERYIIQTITIEQALRPKPEQISSVQQRGEMLQLRGRLIPLVQLGELFGVSGRVDPCEAMVVIARSDDRLMGLVVEELIGQQQVVIKTLGTRFEKLQGIAGAAILGDGHVGLILETSGLANVHDATTSLEVSTGAGPSAREGQTAECEEKELVTA